MKKYKVEFTEEAREDALAATAYIAAFAPLNAARWYSKLEKAIRSLEVFPQRCPMAPESALLGELVRHMIFGKYRILFVIEGRVVRILHVRHGARRPLGGDDDVE